MIDGKLKKQSPSIDEWLKEAKKETASLQEGMFLVHNGVVRQTPKLKVRQGIDDGTLVKGMEFTYDALKVEAAIDETYKMDGIFHVRVWLNEGHLQLGDDIMYVLIGGDIRPHVVDALQSLVGKIKNECVTEIENK
ncbi:MAG: molybdopterin converting factor, subunit 2 [Sedimentibacter sp.]|jgi:molybdopterin synthase catalytic subunit|nr:molybdopterin converting factor, subunit 2 [Sedimentibacter sp.]